MGRVGFGPTTPRYLYWDFKGYPLTSAVCSPRLSYLPMNENSIFSLLKFSKVKFLNCFSLK